MNRVPVPATPVDSAPDLVTERLGGRRVPVPELVLAEIAASGAEVLTDEASRVDAGRDWWPLGIAWAFRGQVPARAAAVVRPSSTDQVARILASCSSAGIPVTPMAGRSGVCGGAVPLFGGIALDLTGLTGPVIVDETSLIADVPAGMFGPDLESELRSRGTGYTLGHWPQSMELSTVGGWLACRGAGQLSTRYGKIEDMVMGLEVVLADGRVVRTEGRGPRAATGPNLTQLFLGCEGTLGVITKARLRLHPRPPATDRRAFGFPSFAAGLDACRRILRRGATPAVLRLYDEVESERNFGLAGACALVVLDEADPGLLAATLAVVDEECDPADPSDPGREGAPGGERAAERLGDDLVDHWLAQRNDVSALVPLWRAGVVVDTVEVSGRWAVLDRLADHVLAGLRAIPGTVVASVHESHAYPEGACLYFTFAGRDPEEPGPIPVPGSAGAPRALPEARPSGAPGSLAWQEAYYRLAWDTVMAVAERHGAAISHHHGIGLNRARFMTGSLGGELDVLGALKRALDPAGILNPGKLGLPTGLGEAPWP